MDIVLPPNARPQEIKMIYSCYFFFKSLKEYQYLSLIYRLLNSNTSIFDIFALLVSFKYMILFRVKPSSETNLCDILMKKNTAIFIHSRNYFWRHRLQNGGNSVSTWLFSNLEFIKSHPVSHNTHDCVTTVPNGLLYNRYCLRWSLSRIVVLHVFSLIRIAKVIILKYMIEMSDHLHYYSL